MKFHELLNKYLSSGLMKAFSSNRLPFTIVYKCDQCGYLVPKYKGKYVKNCPQCKKELTKIVTKGKEDNE